MFVLPENSSGIEIKEIWEEKQLVLINEEINYYN